MYESSVGNTLYKTPVNAAMAASALMVLSLCALLLAAFVPDFITAWLGYPSGTADNTVIPVTYFLYAALYAAIILSAVMMIIRKGRYAPLVIAVTAAALSQFFFLPTTIERIYTARFKGEAALVALSAYSGFSNRVNCISFVGIVLCIAAASAYAFLKGLEMKKAVGQPSHAARVVVAVFAALYVFSAAAAFFIGKNVIYADSAPSMNAGFYIPAGFLANIALAVLLAVFALFSMDKAAIILSALYPAVVPIAQYCEQTALSESGETERIVYCASLYSLNQYIAPILGAAAIIAACAAGRALCIKSIQSGEEIHSV